MLIDNTNLLFGLERTVIEKINSIFFHYPAVEKAIVYGSRAKGTYRVGSDIDLTLIGHLLDYEQLINIATEIDDLLLPYKIDLSLYSQITNAELLSHIDKIGLVWYHTQL